MNTTRETSRNGQILTVTNAVTNRRTALYEVPGCAGYFVNSPRRAREIAAKLAAR